METKKRFVGVFIVLMLVASGLHAQFGAPPGAFQDSVYANVKITYDVVYGSNKNIFKNNNVDTLRMDVYEPDTAVDYLRPVIIYLHAGGFTTGDKQEARAVKLGNHFARLGYLYSSISYRIGTNVFPDTVDNYQLAYQSTQDALSAVRYFKKHWLSYCVDTNSVFLIGSSSGAAICLAAAYWDQDEADQDFDTSPLGPLDQSSGNEGPSSKIHGIVPCWGGIPDTTWLKNETEPAYLFHGTSDNVVPYEYGLSYNGVYLHGSYNIHKQLLANGVESHLYAFNGAGHGVPVNSIKYDTVIIFSTEFFFDHLSPAAGNASCGFTAAGFQMGEPEFFQVVQSSPSSRPALINYSHQGATVALEWISLEGKLFGAEELYVGAGQSVYLEPRMTSEGFCLLRLRHGAMTQVRKIFVTSGM